MININQKWFFKKLSEESIDLINNLTDMKLKKENYECVNLPHTWYVDGNGYEGTVIYKKELELSYGIGKRVFLNFGAADRWCKVFVNGNYIGEHKGGYSAFTFDITKACHTNGKNEIIVLLDNRAWNVISPLAGDFTVFGGLYRDVNLIITDEVCFDRSYFGTSGLIVKAEMDLNQKGKLSVTPHVLGAENKNVSILYKVLDYENQIVAQIEGKINQDEQIVIKDPIRWDGLKNPVLYTLHAELRFEGDTVDCLDIPFGFRSILLDAEKGFFLNEAHLKINGVAKHQDYAGVFNATTMAHWNKDIEDILDIGANSVRLSHYQHPQEMYNLCDQKGLIVWAEIPMLKLTEEEELFENACNQMKELIFQNIHHPSICFWGIQNEIAMFGESEYMHNKMKELNELVKSLDSTRISACANLLYVNNDSKLNQITDAVGYNIYYGWYYGNMQDNQDFVEKFHCDNPNIPLGITEYGVDCNLAFHSDTPKIKDYSEEYQALYHETVYPIFKSKDYIWGSYIWNLYDFSSGIRDEGGIKYKNSKGLISYDRQIKKDAYYYYKAQWSSEPFIKIAQSRFVNREKETITIKVYSNQKSIELCVGQNEYEGYSTNGVFEFKDIPINKGENIIKACCGTLLDEVKFVGVEEIDQSYVFVDANPGLNVKNWFLDALEEEKLFPKGKFSIRDTCDVIVENEFAMKVLEEFSLSFATQIRERKGKMPLERILNYMKEEISEEQCKALNAKLIQIEKNSSV